MDDVARESIFETAIGAHTTAEKNAAGGVHAAMVAILKRQQSRADGVSMIGNLRVRKSSAQPAGIMQHRSD